RQAAQDREEDVDPEVRADADLKKRGDGRKKQREDDLDDGHGAAPGDVTRPLYPVPARDRKKKPTAGRPWALGESGCEAGQFLPDSSPRSCATRADSPTVTSISSGDSAPAASARLTASSNSSSRDTISVAGGSASFSTLIAW